MRDIKIIVSIWRENMLRYLSADILCSEKRTVFQSAARGKLWASRNRSCPRTNIRASFRPKWRLRCLLSFKSFTQRAQFWKLEYIERYHCLVWKETEEAEHNFFDNQFLRTRFSQNRASGHLMQQIKKNTSRVVCLDVSLSRQAFSSFVVGEHLELVLDFVIQIAEIIL